MANNYCNHNACLDLNMFLSPCRRATRLLDSRLNSLGPWAQGTAAKDSYCIGIRPMFHSCFTSPYFQMWQISLENLDTNFWCTSSRSILYLGESDEATNILQTFINFVSRPCFLRIGLDLHSLGNFGVFLHVAFPQEIACGQGFDNFSTDGSKSFLVRICTALPLSL